MTTHRPTGSVDVVLTAGESRPLRRPAQDIPFRMLLMGNFSGRESSPEGARRRPPITWRPLRVDRDNLQSIPGKLSATLEGRHMLVARQFGRVCPRYQAPGYAGIVGLDVHDADCLPGERSS